MIRSGARLVSVSVSVGLRGSGSGSGSGRISVRGRVSGRGGPGGSGGRWSERWFASDAGAVAAGSRRRTVIPSRHGFYLEADHGGVTSAQGIEGVLREVAGHDGFQKIGPFGFGSAIQDRHPGRSEPRAEPLGAVVHHVLGDEFDAQRAESAGREQLFVAVRTEETPGRRERPQVPGPARVVCDGLDGIEDLGAVAAAAHLERQPPARLQVFATAPQHRFGVIHPMETRRGHEPIDSSPQREMTHVSLNVGHVAAGVMRPRKPDHAGIRIDARRRSPRKAPSELCREPTVPTTEIDDVFVAAQADAVVDLASPTGLSRGVLVVVRRVPSGGLI